MDTATTIVTQAYAQYGALFLLAISGWGAAWVLYRDLVRTRQKFDSLQVTTLTQMAELSAILGNLSDNRRLEDLVRELSKK
jgi:hypothetical protein